MNLEPEMYVIMGALVLFYLRIVQLRGRKRRLEKLRVMKHMQESNRKKGKLAPLPPKDPNAPPFQVSSWILVAVAVILMLVGVAARSSTIFPALMQQYWWVITTLGILVFIPCFKVE